MPYIGFLYVRLEGRVGEVEHMFPSFCIEFSIKSTFDEFLLMSLLILLLHVYKKC